MGWPLDIKRTSTFYFAWNNGESAKDPEIAALAALSLLYRKPGDNGVANPTETAITSAIDKYGEHDGKYGSAVMKCAKSLDAGNFNSAYKIIDDYTTCK